jgi:hypothetical protein
MTFAGDGEDLVVISGLVKTLLFVSSWDKEDQIREISHSFAIQTPHVSWSHFSNRQFPVSMDHSAFEL